MDQLLLGLLRLLRWLKMPLAVLSACVSDFRMKKPPRSRLALVFETPTFPRGMRGMKYSGRWMRHLAPALSMCSGPKSETQMGIFARRIKHFLQAASFKARSVSDATFAQLFRRKNLPLSQLLREFTLAFGSSTL